MNFTQQKSVRLVLAIMFAVGMTSLTIAAEHGGKEHGSTEAASNEHGGKEHDGKKAANKERGGKKAANKEHGGKEHGGEPQVKAPTKDEIRSTMKNHVLDSSKETGAFEVFDVDTGKTRKLSLIRVHKRVGKTGDNYYSCADFKDIESGELLDLDLDVESIAGGLSVADVRIHKVSGEPRYTYDDNDNRIPLVKGTKSHIGKSAAKAKDVKAKAGKEHGGKDPAKEHGSKEHGGE